MTWLQLLLPPGACRPNLPIRHEKPEICCYVKSFHFSVIHEFLGNIVQTQKNTSTGQTWPLGHQIKTPGLPECELEQESPNLGEWEAGSFLEEVGLKTEGRGLRRVCCMLVDSGDIGKMGGARTLRALA